MSQFATSFPAISTSEYWGDRVVTQGHADYCAANGHASWVIDGVDQGLCPRCGESTPPSMTDELHGREPGDVLVAAFAFGDYPKGVELEVVTIVKYGEAYMMREVGGSTTFYMASAYFQNN